MANLANESFTITREQLQAPINATCIVTGGCSGIGMQTVVILHELGNNVVSIDRSPPIPSAPQSLTSSSRFHHHQCDITDWKAQRQGFENAFQKYGGIHYVYVNAGIAEFKDQFFQDDLDSDGLLSEPDRRVIEIDTNAANDTVKLAVYYMKKSGIHKKDSQGRYPRPGGIVLTASLAGYLASAGAPLYSAAKHGIVGLMRALKNDVATLNIAISLVAPGITLTEIISGRQPGQSLSDWAVSMRKQGVPINDPAEVARLVVWLMGLGMEANGKGCLIQAGQSVDLEKGIAKTRRLWMSETQLNLFRGGREAPLFPNKLEGAHKL